MIISRINLFLILFLSLFALTSCFKEDERLLPPPPGEATLHSFNKSIYTHHSYFDFSSDSTTAESLNDTWHIEFATTPEAWDIRVNSSAYYQVYNTDDTLFNGIVSVTDPLKYIFDTSNGKNDSCAFASWIDRSVNPFSPTNKVFLVGQYDGIKVKPKWKIRIEGVSDTSFSFTYAAFPNGIPVKVDLDKDQYVNYVQYNLATNSFIKAEPSKTDYDILFTQYGTTLYDNLGTATPYFVRGILLNPFKVEAALDTLLSFDEITYELIKDLPFSNVRDVIGHEWKDVKVDVNTNTAEYFVNTRLNWLIKDTEGLIYKMRFIEYYNSEAQVGYTTIEYQRL